MNEWTEEDARLALKYAKRTLDAVNKYLTEAEEQESQEKDETLE